MQNTVTRKQLRDIRVGEMLVFHGDIACPWAIVEAVESFPADIPNSKGCRAVLLTKADGHIGWIGMRLNGWWDVAE